MRASGSVGFFNPMEKKPNFLLIYPLQASIVATPPLPALVSFHEQMVLQTFVVDLFAQALLLRFVVARFKLLPQCRDLVAQFHFERQHAGVFENFERRAHVLRRFGKIFEHERLAMAREIIELAFGNGLFDFFFREAGEELHV